jgi:hypothetical protein
MQDARMTKGICVSSLRRAGGRPLEWHTPRSVPSGTPPPPPLFFSSPEILQIIINPHGINAFQRPSAGRPTLDRAITDWVPHPFHSLIVERVGYHEPRPAVLCLPKMKGLGGPRSDHPKMIGCPCLAFETWECWNDVKQVVSGQECQNAQCPCRQQSPRLGRGLCHSIPASV